MKVIRVTIKDRALVNGLEYKEAVFPVEIPYSEENMAWAEANCYEGVPVVFDRAEPRITAPNNILEGEYVTVNGVLYIATQNIPNGEPIIVGQNAVVTTIEAQLLELKGE